MGDWRQPCSPCLTSHRTSDVPAYTDDGIDLLVDVDPGVRLATVMQLGEQRRADAAAALVERFGRERDFQIREALTWATLRMPDAAMPLVRHALTSRRWLARLQAAHTLSKLALAEDTSRLVPLVDDAVDCVAARAYWAVAQCGDPVAVPALVGQLGRGDAEHRNSLLVAISAFDEVAELLVDALIRGAAPDVRQHAADTLAWLGAPTSSVTEQALVQALDDTVVAVRVAALNALGGLHSRSAQEAIEARTAADGRLGMLARRLTADRTRSADGPDRPQISPTQGQPVGRSWPRPDLSVVTITDSPLGARLHPMLAQQVTVARPTFLRRVDVPAEVLDMVAGIARQRALAVGRSTERADRIAAGHAELYIHEHVFYEQAAVADPGRTIDGLLYGTGIKILDFDAYNSSPPPN